MESRDPVGARPCLPMDMGYESGALHDRRPERQGVPAR